MSLAQPARPGALACAGLVFSETAYPQGIDLYWGRIEADLTGAGPASLSGLLDSRIAVATAPALPETASAHPGPRPNPAGRLRAALRRFDFAQDLAEDIGSARWRRGFAVMVALMVCALTCWPDWSPLQAASAARIDAPAQAEFRSQTQQPLAFAGGDSHAYPLAGTAPGATMVAIAAAPDRPRVDLATTLGQGDSLGRMLQRAGVGSGDAERVANLVAGTVPLAQIAPGTRFAITLGARGGPGEPRPVDHIAFRPRFDLALDIVRHGPTLGLSKQAIPVDNTPLRIRGLAGSSLYLSARAAGVPFAAIQQYLQTLDAHMSLDNVSPTDTFDIITAYKRSASGAAEPGNLLYAGLEHDGHPLLQLMRWGDQGQFLGAGEMAQGGGTTSLIMPVSGGHITSLYGMRFHPILGYTRMHAGVDFGAPYGSPIYAVADGMVSFAGVHGGHGNYVRLEHGAGLGSGYGHMSRIAVSPGMHVHSGEVIGYVGSTGLSTGPHLHYEVYRDGQTVDPLSVHFTMRAAGVDHATAAAYKARLAKLLLVKPGAALGPMRSAGSAFAGPR